MPMATAEKVWTLEELHSLPDDGNKYELVRGTLFVTPSPSASHESILVRLTRIIDPYVVAHGLGMTYRARAAFRVRGSEVEPDLMVRRVNDSQEDWETAPPPILVVEVLSSTTRRRDREDKRSFYLGAGVAEYWLVDPESRSITTVQPGSAEIVNRDAVRWWPTEAAVPLEIALSEVFGTR
jgi:Uma2 family endonuclease